MQRNPKNRAHDGRYLRQIPVIGIYIRIQHTALDSKMVKIPATGMCLDPKDLRLRKTSSKNSGDRMHRNPKNPARDGRLTRLIPVTGI